MLKELDLERVIERAFAQGFTHAEFYAERSFIAHTHLNDKAPKSELSQEGGISLRLSSEGGQTCFLRTNRFSTDALLSLLGSDAGIESSTAETLLSTTPYSTDGIHHLKNKTSELTQLARRLSLSNEGLRSSGIDYCEKVQIFEVMHSDDTRPGIIHEGREERAQFKMQSHCTRKGKELAFVDSIVRSSIPELWTDLERLALRMPQRLQQMTPTPWPAPSGKIPILWSSLSVAKLCLPFLRAFEGDLVLKEISFLNDLNFPLDLSFGLEDCSHLTNVARDHEGTPLTPLTFFDGARPRGLATNRDIASELSVNPTGHCRRTSYESLPTIGFWHPRMIGRQQEQSPLLHVKEGVWVEDIDILSNPLRTGKIRIRLKEASLIHQHSRGEWIEPIEWEISLQDILASFKLYSTESNTWGFLYPKQQQELLTELTTPIALSEGLNLPGNVPKSHYW